MQKLNTSITAYSQEERDGCIFCAYISMFVLWAITISPLRATIWGESFPLRWLGGVMPSFFFGMTWTFWKSFIDRTRPMDAAEWAVALVVLSEIIQVFLPWYTVDFWDIVAGIAGVGMAMPILIWCAKRTSRVTNR